MGDIYYANNTKTIDFVIGFMPAPHHVFRLSGSRGSLTDRVSFLDLGGGGTASRGRRLYKSTSGGLDGSVCTGLFLHYLGRLCSPIDPYRLRGKESEHEVQFSLILDEEAPEILGAKDLSALVGDGVSYRNGVTVCDNCDGELTLTVDSSQVDNTTEGNYPVIYTATDAAGNKTVLEIRVYFYLEKVTEEMLFAEIDGILEERIPSYLSREEQVREVYDYVYYHVSYNDSSDKSDWVRAAYEGIRTGQGDCYTYFALSKAFFVRLGIENMDIQRTTGIVEERHYWNLVNIGTEESPLWYHYDATRLSGIQHSGCLLTDQQVRAYTKQRVNSEGQGDYFYVYDSTQYPESASKIITPTPALENYY